MKPLESRGNHRTQREAGAVASRQPERALRVEAFLRHCPRLCGGLSIFAGIAVLAAWWLGHPQLASIFTGRPVMMPNTALMAVLAGASLLMLAPVAVSKRRAVIGKLCTGIAGSIAALTIAEYALGLDLGIDQVLMPAEYPALRERYPGRTSPESATAFAALAGALLALNRKTARVLRPAETLALLSGLISLVALLGHLFEIAALYGRAALVPHVGVSVPAALALLALSVGVIAARFNVGVLSILVAHDNGGIAARRFMAALLVLAPVVCAIALGPRVGAFSPQLAFVLIVLLMTVGGCALVLKVSWRLSDLDRERQWAAAQLRLSQERLELALRGGSMATWDWNVTSGEVIFNQRWAEMRGFRPDEVAPHVDSWSSAVHPDDWPLVRRTLTDHFKGRIPEYENEHRVRTRSGDWIWILARGKVVERDRHGRPTRMAGTALDITSRKRLEEELRIAEARSSGILSISADAIISIDDQQRIVSFNEGAEKVFGYSKAEAIGAPLDILLPERFRAVHRRHVDMFAASQDVARRAGERDMALVGLRKDGQEFPADASISKLDVGGTKVLTAVLRDITERKRREGEQVLVAEAGAILSSSFEVEQTLTSVAQLAVGNLADLCLVDLIEEDGEVRRLTVVSRDPSNAWICDVLMRIQLDRTRPHLTWSVLETKRPVLIETVTPDAIASWSQSEEHRRALEAIAIGSIVAVPILAYEKLLGVIFFVRSTTSKAYESADLHLAEALAERAALAIMNARHYRAAQRAIEARDSVIGIVAHDLRNPLGAIIMQAAMLRQRGLEPDRRSSKPIELIERSATRMNRLIKDLLDVTSIDAGRLSVECGRVPANQVIAESVEAQRTLAAQASLELRLDAAPGLPEVWADRDRLLQIFENLIGNAVKFTEPGGRITVGATPLEAEVLFWVSDTGAGIEAANLPYVFDRFWRTGKPERRGAGLGLPIVKGIVEAHKGRLWVESAPGRGSTFFFTIPMALDARPQPVGTALSGQTRD